MVDGAATLTTVQHGLLYAGYQRARGCNMIDSGAHFYNTYETADGEYIAIGSFEPHFYRQLLERLGVTEAEFPEMDMARWPQFKESFAALFRTRTRQEWCEIFEGTDACFAPVLSLAEAPRHPHNVARGVFVEVAGVVQPRPSPRFSRTDGAIQRPPARPGEHTRDALADWGIDAGRIERLALAQSLGRDPRASRETLELWAAWWRDLLLLSGRGDGPVVNVDRLAELRSLARPERLGQSWAAVRALQNAAAQIEDNVNPRLALEGLLLKLPRWTAEEG